MPAGVPYPRGPLYHDPSPMRNRQQQALQLHEQAEDGSSTAHLSPPTSNSRFFRRPSADSSQSSSYNNSNGRGSCSCSCCSCCSLSLLILLIALIAGLCIFLDDSKHWVFDPATLQDCALSGMAVASEKAKSDGREIATAAEVIEAVQTAVKNRYPDFINTTENGDREWIFNNAGGAMGQMIVLHASLTEYVIIFGSPLGTEGHTGRYPLTDDYFTIIFGEQWATLPSSFEKEVYIAGKQHHLPRGVAKQYKIPDSGCFALEYARGNIPSMMAFGFLDSLFSTLDYYTLWKTVEVSTVDIVSYLLKGKI